VAKKIPVHAIGVLLLKMEIQSGINCSKSPLKFSCYQLTIVNLFTILYPFSKTKTAIISVSAVCWKDKPHLFASA